MKYLNAQKMESLLDARIADDINACRIGGAGICVMQAGKVLYKRYHGMASYASNTPLDDQNGDRTLFRLASMSKPITAVATLIQVSRGQLALDEPIESLLPEFADMSIGELDENGNICVTGKAKTKLTPRILLNHTSGIGSMPVGDKQMANMTPGDKTDIAHVVNCISRSVLAFEPASSQMYSPVWAFDVAARLIELTSGVDFYTFLRHNVFEPCGMVDTVFAPSDDQWSRMIAMHARKAEGDAVSSADAPMPAGIVFGDIPVTWFSGGAGLASTLPDYVRFAEMLRRRGVTAEGVRILPGELVDAMGTPTVPESIMPGGERWGLGVRVITERHPWMPAGCFGWSGAYGSHYWVDPENQITVVLMRNSTYDGGAGAVAACNLEKDVYAAL